MPPRRSAELDVPAEPRPVEEPPSNVLDFFAPPRLPFDVSPIAVLEMALGLRRRATEKAVARNTRRRKG
jgi:hypothetical protein